jgi:hypothetical protein
LDPAPEDEISMVVIRMTRNLQTLDLDTYLGYRGTINTADITICVLTVPKFQGWLKTFEVDYKFTQSIPGDIFGAKKYPAITVEIVVNPYTWFVQKVHSGKIEGGGGAAGIKLLKDEDGHPIPIDANLNAAGVPIGVGGAPIMLNFHTKWEMPWSGLVPDILPADNPEDF